MKNIAHSEPKSQRDRLRERLVGRLAEAHCHSAALHGYCQQDLTEAKLNPDGYVNPRRIEELQLQHEILGRFLSDIARLNLAIRNLPPDGAQELGAVAVYPLHAVMPSGEAQS